MNISDDYVLEYVKSTGQKAYLVGGYVRDFFLNKKTYDRDIVVSNAKEFSQKLANNLSGTFIVLDEENKIYRVVLSDKLNFIDISEPVGNSIENDLGRRDFTINAIAYDIQTSKYIDIYNGINDIENKVLNGIRDENFYDDPLRVLRAFRFMSTTGFKFTDKLAQSIDKHKHMLVNPSKERINYEIMKLFGGNYASETLLKMDEFGILADIFPCVNEMKKVPPNSHHHLDLFHHSVETVKNIEKLYGKLVLEHQTILNNVDFGGFPRINHLKLSGFLHDIGKFSTWTIEESGRHRFIKHDDVGAKICIPLLKDLKFSKKQIEYISLMIKNHIYPSNVLQSPDLCEKVMMRYIRKMDNNVLDNIILAKADRLSAKGPDITEEVVNANISGLDKLLKFYFEKKETLKPLPKLLDGQDIMQLINIKPSPLLGKIVNDLKEAQISGDVVTKDDAVEFVLNYKKDMLEFKS